VAKTPKRAGPETPPPDELDPAQEALFREVEEDLRADQMRKLWQRYGGYVIGTAVLIVAVVAGFQGWTAWQASVRADEAQRYFTAVQAGVPVDDALLALAREGQTGYAALAALQRANSLAEAGKTAEAIAAYDAVSSDGRLPGAIREAAAMVAALYAMDVESETSLRGRLTPLTEDGGAWRFMALELLALLDLRSGNTDAARQAFTELSQAREAPAGVRARASERLVMMGAASQAGG